jgi:hypothetical protein
VTRLSISSAEHLLVTEVLPPDVGSTNAGSRELHGDIARAPAFSAVAV